MMDKKFIKQMFGITQAPHINFGLKELSQQAQRMTGKLSISGVQPKLVMTLNKADKALEVAAEGEYILKPQNERFAHIPENEQCCMDMAAVLGIDVPLHCLLPMSDGSSAYIVKRFDRRGDIKIHQEDFYQILEARDKYRGSVEHIGKALKTYSSVPGLDVQLFFERVLFNFLIGNGDAHLKNYSISYLEDGQLRLSPAYDLVSSKLVIPEEEESALTINGKKNALVRRDFDGLAQYLSIPQNVCYDVFEGQFDVMEQAVTTSPMPREHQEKLVALMRQRFDCLYC